MPDATRRSNGVSDLERARRRVVVYLVVLAFPGTPVATIAKKTNLSRRVVDGITRDLVREKLIVTAYETTPSRCSVVAYGVPQPDPAAATTLEGLLRGPMRTTLVSTADIRSLGASASMRPLSLLGESGAGGTS